MEKEISKLINQVSGLIDSGTKVVVENLPEYCKQVVEYQIFVNNFWLWFCVIFSIICFVVFIVKIGINDNDESAMFPFFGWIGFSIFAAINYIILIKLKIAPLVFLIDYLKRQVNL